MKLPELKKKFRKKYVIRIVAGILVVALAGAPVSAVKAAGMSDEAAGERISTEEREVGKEETVYVITDSTGKEKEVIVSSHLINSDGKNTIRDTSSLKEIENVKGNETYTRDGDGIDWKAEGNDIFYRGNSDGPVPVSQRITYYLDGKEITAEELAGKSGKVKIRFDYTNNQKVKMDIDGKQTKVCVPFVAVSGLVLDEKFSNIKVENGKVMADGKNSMVIGYTMPGLKESLNVNEADFDGEIRFPEYFEVTADVEHFSLNTTMTVVMNAADFVSREGGGDTSTLSEAFETLEDAAGQLENGSAELADGTGTLKSKMGEFSDGVGTLASGIRDYTDGASSLAEGIGTLQGGVQSLTDNVPALTGGVGQLKEGSASAAQGAAALKEGTGSLKAGASELYKGAAELSTGADDLFAGAGTLSAGADELSAGAGTLSAGANDLYAGAGTLSAGAGDLLAGANSLSEGVTSLAQGTKDALAGAGALSAGASSLNDGVGMLVGKIQGMGGQLEQTKNGLFAQAGVSTCEEMEGALGQLRAARDQCQTAMADAAAAGAADQAAAAAAQLAEINGKIEALQSALGAITVIGQVQQELSDPDVMTQLNALETGAGELAAGAADLVAGLDALSQGADGAAAGASGLAAGAGELAAGAGNLVTGAGNLAAGVGELATGAGNLAAGAGELVTGAGNLAAGAGKVSGGAKQVSDGSAQVDEGASGLASGLGTLDAGLGVLNEKAGMLGSGAAALKDGTDRLAAGAAQLVANNMKLNDGAHKISDGTTALANGIGTLDDGAQRLADGIVEFNEEGMEKILETFNGDIAPLMNRMQAVLDAGNDYQSYAGLADGVNGSVKFIYKTEAVKAE